MADRAVGLAPGLVQLREQTRAEILKLVRSPIFSLFSLLLPLMFYAFFGIPNADAPIGGIHGGTYLMASFGAYAVANVMLFTFGISVAVERGRKMDVLMRATPLRGWVYLTSRILAAIAFGIVALALLGIFATLAGGVRLDAFHWFDLAWKLVLGSTPLLMLGFAIGYLVGPNAAPAVVNLIGLPLYFASGLFTPLRFMPDFIQHIGPYLPTYLYAQLAWNAVGAQSDPLWRDLVGLVIYIVVFGGLALWAFRQQETRRFS